MTPQIGCPVTCQITDHWLTHIVFCIATIFASTDGVGLGDVPRGVYKGTVFVRWLTNRLLLVGAYSPFIKEPSPAAWLAQSQQGSRMTLSGKAVQSCIPAIQPGWL